MQPPDLLSSRWGGGRRKEGGGGRRGVEGKIIIMFDVLSSQSILIREPCNSHLTTDSHI